MTASRARRTFLAIGCLTLATTSRAATPLSEKEVADLSGFGTKVLGIKWAGRLAGANERDVIAVSDGTITLTMRKRSRTYILHNKKVTLDAAKMQFAGTDEELQRVGMRILQDAGCDRRQVADVHVLQQRTQAAEVVPKGGKPKFQPVQRGLRSLMVTRQIDGLPVLSSHLLLNLDHNGQVAFMELSWPEISPAVVEKAAEFHKIVSGGFEAPHMDGATVESIQASILHSPAIGFYNDETAAIRVIYRPDAKNVGQKPVRYVDALGNDVTEPRDVDLPREEPVKRAPSYR